MIFVSEVWRARELVPNETPGSEWDKFVKTLPKIGQENSM